MTKTWVTSKLIEGIIGIEEFKTLECFDKTKLVAISILDPDNNEDMSQFYNEFKAVLSIKFWDVEETIVITAEQGAKIASFIQEHSNERFLIHCSAGVSRSAGVGLAVEAIINHHGDKYTASQYPSDIKNHTRYFPNLSVYDSVMDGFKEDTSLKQCNKCSAKFKEFTETTLFGKPGLMCPICYNSELI